MRVPDRQSRSMAAVAVAATQGAGQQLPRDVASDLGRHFDHDLGDVRVHADPEAGRAAQQLRARAFTFGRHIVFGPGRYDPQTAAGRGLVAHELAHVVQGAGRATPVGLSSPGDDAEREAAAASTAWGPGAEQTRHPGSGGPDAQSARRHPASAGPPWATTALVHRDVVNDPGTGDPVGFEFRVGVELRLDFMRLAQQLLGGGVLHTRGLGALRDDALAAHGTVDDHERMFMAGLTVAANATALAATRLAATAAVTFPLSTITPNLPTVVNIGRESVPAAVTAPMTRARAALTRMEIRQALVELTAASTAASGEIIRHAGSFRATAQDVVDWATERRVSLTEVLEAMLAGASDSSAGDRVLAAMVFTITRAAGLPEAASVQSGRIKVDALIPSAFAALPGAANMAAFYVTVSQASGVKGDTIYVPTTLDIYDLSDRSSIVHELTHARDDRGAAGASVTFTAKDQLEVRAYRAQGRYLLTELEATPSAQRPAILATLAGRVGALALWGMLIEALSDRAKFEPLVAGLAAATTPSVSAAAVAALLNRGAAALEARLVGEINSAYALPAGQLAPVDGLAGESLVHYIFRL